MLILCLRVLVRTNLGGGQGEVPGGHVQGQVRAVEGKLDTVQEQVRAVEGKVEGGGG